MEVFPKNGEKFDYTAQAIKVVGKLEVAPDPNQPFTDEYGYQFNFKIVDASYTVISAEDLSEDLALWQKLAESDVINDIYKMYDYVNFLCAWDTYFVNSYENEKGETVPGYYLHAEDAKYYLYTDGAQWNYGYKEGYFEGLRNKIRAVDPNAFADLIANIDRAEALAKRSLGELEAGNYTKEYQYIEKFGTSDYVFTLTAREELAAEMKAVYTEFSDWLGSWEM
ncbi:MAG: hypothetical protein IJW49_03860 [Clostridia bacterium]|nr:hypothetical protein [Clostridia bacterium]